MFLQTSFNYPASALPSPPNFVSPAAHSAAFSPPRSCTSVSPQYHLSHTQHTSHLSSPHQNPFNFRPEGRSFQDQYDAGIPHFSQQPQEAQKGKKGKNKDKKKKKKKRKKGEPNGYCSGFNFFALSLRSREKMKDKLVPMKNNEINKMIGVEWNLLPPSEKVVFERMGEDDKLRYLCEVHEYNLTHEEEEDLVPTIDPPFGYDLSGQPLPGDLDSSLAGGCLPPSLAQKRKQKQDQKRGRRPDPGRSGALKNATTVQRQRTSYSIFAHQEKDFLKNLNCPDLRRRMGKYLGSRWKNMPAAERRMYDLLEASGATISKKPRV